MRPVSERDADSARRTWNIFHNRSGASLCALRYLNRCVNLSSYGKTPQLGFPPIAARSMFGFEKMIRSGPE
jgi:hypothetical protein